MLKKCSLENPLAKRLEARLPYPTLTSGQQVCITRKGDPALRLPTNRGQDTHLSIFGLPHRGSPRSVGQIPSTFIGACHIVLSSEECTPIPSTFICACHIVLYCETLCFLCRALETRKPNEPYTLYKRPLYPFEKSPRNMDRCT